MNIQLKDENEKALKTIKDLKEKIKQMNIMLRIPVKHRRFLEQNGALEEFIEAKILGKSELSKWILLATAKDELSDLIQFNKKFDSIPSKKMNPSRLSDK